MLTRTGSGRSQAGATALAAAGHPERLHPAAVPASRLSSWSPGLLLYSTSAHVDWNVHSLTKYFPSSHPGS
jgi:hypothetical protein